jgi:hypothetical protein
VVDEVGGTLGALVADEEPTDRAPGGGCRRSDGAHALELGHVEGVEDHPIGVSSRRSGWSNDDVALQAV